MLNAPKPDTQRTLIPAGTHIARCIGLIHIGNIPGEYMGEAKIFNKIRLTWELPEELKVFKEGEEAKPLVISQEYTLSMGNKSKLLPLVEGMIGTTLAEDEAYNFDHETLVGMPCLLSIAHKKSAKGTMYQVVSSASRLMKGQVCKEAFNSYNILTYSNWNQEYFDKLPDFIKDQMKTSKEYKALKGIEEDVNASDLPF
jgi:hypothetical protein